MCLITDQKVALIATKDMTVYKALQPNRQSVYTYFNYEEGKLYETDIEDDTDWCGYDSKSTGWLDVNYRGWQDGNSKELRCFGKGFHSALTIERFDPGEEHDSIYRCTIPEGSEYYVSRDGLCVSNTIIIHEVVAKIRGGEYIKVKNVPS